MPSPKYPGLHWQIYDPAESVQIALPWQRAVDICLLKQWKFRRRQTLISRTCYDHQRANRQDLLVHSLLIPIEGSPLASWSGFMSRRWHFQHTQLHSNEHLYIANDHPGWNCSGNLLEHVTPYPWYPELHRHENEPSVLVHVAWPFGSQLWVPVRHSFWSTGTTGKVTRRRYIHGKSAAWLTRNLLARNCDNTQDYYRH